MGIKWLHHVTRHKTVIDAIVLVLLELRQLILSYVHHLVYGSVGCRLLLVEVHVCQVKVFFAKLKLKIMRK
jgi:hypothetical protein